MYKLILVLASALSISSYKNHICAQTIPVGAPVLEEYYRRSQLDGKADSTISFTIRPLLSGFGLNDKDIFYPDSTHSLASPIKRSSSDIGKTAVKALPLTWASQFNTHHPYGWNDGAFIPARGLQFMISGGIYVKRGPLSIQLRPELVVAENESFKQFQFPSNEEDVSWARYYDFHYNKIDLPERFGNDPYAHLNWGQSSIRLTVDRFSFGISNENLWWGPGTRNSLLMSNTAPGFKHLTFNTVRPVQTPIGSFETQLIAGLLKDSGFEPPEADRLYKNIPVYIPPDNAKRILTGFIFSYQPKWLEGLFIGWARTAQAYRRDMGSLIDDLPVFLPFKRFMAEENRDVYDKYNSIFARWLLTKAKGELYFEYGRNNHPFNYENYPENSSHSTAYTFGLKKFVTMKCSTDQILVGLEVTQLQSPGEYANKPGEAWYVNNTIRQGYTHRGQVLGAGIGPGGSLQSLDVSWFRGIKKIGIELERYVHNNDAFYYLFEYTKDPRRHWVDLSMAANVNWRHKDLLFNAKLKGVRSLNYQYFLVQEDDNIYWVPGRDVFNLHAQLGVTYWFKH